MNKQEMDKIVEYRIHLASETLSEAKLPLDNSRLRGAVNRIYYSLFYIVNALALKHNFKTKSHHQLLGWFNKNFIHTGIVKIEFGRHLRKAFEKRQTGDYDDLVEFKKEEVELLYNQAKDFINGIKRLL